MRPITHLLQTEWGCGRERGCVQEPPGHLPWAQACLLEWADTLFIRITGTFRSNAGTFLFLFCKQASSKVVPFLYLGHTVVLLQHLWQIYHFFPINLVFSIFSSWHPFCFMVTQKYNLSQLGSLSLPADASATARSLQFIFMCLSSSSLRSHYPHPVRTIMALGLNY